MTLRQNFLRLVYPVFMFFNKLVGRNAKVLKNKTGVRPIQSFYNLSVKLNNNAALNFETLKGKKVLLVNTASDCGYTNQYHDLQQLFEQEKGKLVIIAFPANDFK